MPLPSGMSTREEIRGMSCDELVCKIDAQCSRGPLDPLDLFIAQIYRDELVRKEQDKATQAMFGYTRKMTRMTVIITIFTFLNLAATVVLLFKT